MFIFKSISISVIFCFLIVNKTDASQSQTASTVEQENNPIALLLGGGIGGGAVSYGTNLLTNKKKDEDSVTDTISQNYVDYKNSPSYLKDQIQVLQAENLKNQAKTNSLRRRFNYIESRLLKVDPTYITYDEKVPAKLTNQ